MLSAFEICKAAYPGIPDQIFLEYADLLPAEAGALSAEFAQTDFFFDAYKKNAPSNIETRFSLNLGQYSYNANFELNFLAPQNSQHAETKVYDSPTLHVPIGVAENPYGIGFGPVPDETLWATYIKPKLSTRYDRRLYSDVVNNINFAFVPDGYSFQQSYLFIMSYSTYTAYTGQSLLIARASAARKNYGGIASIVALYENGITLPSVDYEKAYSFLTYVNSYKKFSTQIDAEKSLLTNQAAASLAAYQQDFKDRADREKTELQSKKLQIFIAIDNEAKSAQRDFQNMLINAQNLRNTLGGSLG